jgi:hypothetical protein
MGRRRVIFFLTQANTQNNINMMQLSICTWDLFSEIRGSRSKKNKIPRKD